MDKLVYLYYPLVLLLLFWGSKWYGCKQWNEEFFSLDQSKMWQGFFAVCIMLHHAGQKTCAPWLQKWYIRPGLDFFVPIGYFLVGFFLLCSGYGLYVSWKRKENYLKGFIRRRVLPLVVAFYVTEWIFLVVRLLMGEKIDTPRIIYYIIGLQQANPNAWFVIAMPIFYLMFYLCFRFIKKEGWAITGVFALILCWVLIGCATDHNDWWMKGEWWYNSALFFPLGLLFGKYKDGFVRVMKKCWWPAIILCVVLGFGLYYLAEYARNAYGYYCEWNKVFSERFLRRIVTVLAEQGPELMFVLFFVLLGMKVKIGNKVLAFMGAVTLEFYLIHALFIDLFGFNFFDVVKSLKYIKNVFLYTLVVAACSIPATLLLRKILHPKQPILPPVKG